MELHASDFVIKEGALFVPDPAFPEDANKTFWGRGLIQAGTCQVYSSTSTS